VLATSHNASESKRAAHDRSMFPPVQPTHGGRPIVANAILVGPLIQILDGAMQ
jgi:hypothetical protein